jgi:hypothetical protein
MLSRVRTQKGLICRFPLSTDVKKYKPPEQLKQMLKDFQPYCVTVWKDEDYNSLLS